jgi:hypothetical protein
MSLSSFLELKENAAGVPLVCTGVEEEADGPPPNEKPLLGGGAEPMKDTGTVDAEVEGVVFVSVEAAEVEGGEERGAAPNEKPEAAGEGVVVVAATFSFSWEESVFSVVVVAPKLNPAPPPAAATFVSVAAGVGVLEEEPNPKPPVVARDEAVEEEETAPGGRPRAVEEVEAVAA